MKKFRVESADRLILARDLSYLEAVAVALDLKFNTGKFYFVTEDIGETVKINAR